MYVPTNRQNSDVKRNEGQWRRTEDPEDMKSVQVYIMLIYEAKNNLNSSLPLGQWTLKFGDRQNTDPQSMDYLNPGVGTPLYGLHRYVRPQRVWFFSRFGLT